MNTITQPRVDFDQDVQEQLDERLSDDDFSGWYCIRTDPFPCPADGCDFIARFQTAAHLIVVWPESDDRDLLTHARNCREANRNPRIVEYEQSFGRCIPYDAWRQMGRPVHGQLPQPDGWDARTKGRL